MESHPLVVNLRHKDKFGNRPFYQVYVGRKCGEFPQSMWGNPFKLYNRTPETERECLALYEKYFWETPHLYKNIGHLRGKILACWCKPQACHANFLAEIANLPYEQFDTEVEVGETVKDGKC